MNDIKEMNVITPALPKLTANDLEGIKILGEGQFGEVQLAKEESIVYRIRLFANPRHDGVRSSPSNEYRIGYKV